MVSKPNDDLVINVPAEFNFKENIRYMLRSLNECMYEVVNDKVVKAITIDDRVVLIELSESETGNLVVHFLGDTVQVNEKLRQKVQLYVRDWFDLDRDLKPFYKMARNDYLLQKIVDNVYGLRIIGIPNLFEALVWAILGQQINLTFAYTLKRRFVETFGSSIGWNNRTYWIFPKAEDIAHLTVEDLTPLRMTVKKSEYILEVARLIGNGNLSKSQLLKTQDIKEAERILTNIRGIVRGRQIMY